MKTNNFFITIALTIATVCGVAHASVSPAVDTLNVQGYMRKANGTAVTDGTYTMAFGVFQHNVAIWGWDGPVTITNGLFSQSLSGLGTSLVGLPAGTAMNVNYGAVTLNPALLMTSAAGEVSIRVYGETMINGSNPQFDIAISAVPTAFVADTAKNVAPNAVTAAGLSVALTPVSANPGGVAGNLVVLGAGALIDASLLPPVATQLGGGTVAIANGGTGATSASAALTALGAAANGANGDITSLTGLTTALPIAEGGTANGTLAVTDGGVIYTNGSKLMNSGAGTGLLSSSGSGAPTWVSLATAGAAASGANSDITSLTGLTTALSIGQGGTGAGTAPLARTALGAAASGANTDITSISPASALSSNPTGTITLGGAATTGVTVSPNSGGVSLTPTAGGVTINPTAGAVSIVSPGASTLTVGGAGTGAATFGNTGAATTVQAGTGGVTITSSDTSATSVQITATGAGGGIKLTPNATGFAQINNAQIVPKVLNFTATASLFIAPAGAEVVNITNITSASAVATITGCNSGVYAQGEKVTFVTTGWTAGALTFTDAAVGTVVADGMVLSAAVPFAFTSTALTKGSSITLMCTQFGNKAWVEVSRSANTN